MSLSFADISAAMSTIFNVNQNIRSLVLLCIWLNWEHQNIRRLANKTTSHRRAAGLSKQRVQNLGSRKVFFNKGCDSVECFAVRVISRLCISKRLFLDLYPLNGIKANVNPIRRRCFMAKTICCSMFIWPPSSGQQI